MANNTLSRLPDKTITDIQRDVTQQQALNYHKTVNYWKTSEPDNTIAEFVTSSYSTPKQNTNQAIALAEFL